MIQKVTSCIDSYLLQVVPDQGKYKPSIHQGEGIMDEEGKTCVQPSTVLHILWSMVGVAT